MSKNPSPGQYQNTASISKNHNQKTVLNKIDRFTENTVKSNNIKDMLLLRKMQKDFQGYIEEEVEETCQHRKHQSQDSCL